VSLAIGVAAAGEETPPSLPQEFWGNQTIDGTPAPAGTVIVAMIDGMKSGSITTTVVGRYGGSTIFEGERLVVSGTEEQVGHNVTFLVNGQAAQDNGAITAWRGRNSTLPRNGHPIRGDAVTSVRGAAISLTGPHRHRDERDSDRHIPVGPIPSPFRKRAPYASTQVTVSR
jgi:hypothetical protein